MPSMKDVLHAAKVAYLPSLNMRINLASKSVKDLDAVANNIKGIAEKTGIKYSGPHPLPPLEHAIYVPKSQRKGDTQYRSVKTHRRIIVVEADERTWKEIMRIDVPETVEITVKQVKREIPIQKKARKRKR